MGKKGAEKIPTEWVNESWCSLCPSVEGAPVPTENIIAPDQPQNQQHPGRAVSPARFSVQHLVFFVLLRPFRAITAFLKFLRRNNENENQGLPGVWCGGWCASNQSTFTELLDILRD